MLIAPTNIETNKLVKKRILNFDTANRMYGNLVLIASDSYDDYTEVMNAKLFKPQQIFSAYIPRRVKPMGRTFVSFDQKEMYQMLKEKTNGFIKIGKALPSSYVGRNLVYDIVSEYNETLNLASTLKKAHPTLHIYMKEYFDNLIQSKTDEMNYENAFIIFPLTKHIPNLKSMIQVPSSEDHSPVVEFLSSLRHGTFSAEKYARVTRIIFYCPGAQAMVVADPSDPNLIDDFPDYFAKINRLNNFNGKLDLLDDITDDELIENDDDNIENTKQKIKNIVLSNVAKKLKTNFDDYDAATMDEKSIIATIDKKIDSYLDKEENTQKPFAELVATIEQDKDISTKAINYIESKKIAQKQFTQLAKNVEREVEVINSINDLSAETDKLIEPEKIQSKINPMVNERVQVSSLTAFDKKYNDVQAKQDLVSCISAFSDQDYLPISIIDWNMVDSSDDFTLKDTLTVRYKTDENRPLSFKIDIPRVFNDHCIKIKGNTYIIQKQLCRLPIVKTKENRVEITTNFNKITCERTNGRISRKNAYLKKILQRYKLNPAYNIEYGYNIEINSSYKNDFEYEELSSFLSKITTMQYAIDTNRPEVEKEFALLEYPESFSITDTMTPVGFELLNNSKNLIYIENGQLFVARKDSAGVSISNLAENLYTFIVRDILHDDPNKDETIGASYIYSTCKFIGVTYPIFVFCGLNVGITAVLKKAKVKYKLSEIKLSHNADWVEVKFKNKYLYYEDKIENTLLLNILNAMHTNDWDYEDFDTDEPYSEYCVNTLGQPIYVKQTVRINVSKLIDPITRDVLNYLKLPTDPFDLLILASKMLTNNSFIPKNDLCNYRVRGNELIYAILYEIIAKAYYKYQNAKLNGSNKETIKIGQNELISTLISQQNINIESKLNPVLEIEAASSCSMKGFKGIRDLLHNRMKRASRR